MNSSSFITKEKSPGFYTFKDISETLLRFLQSEYEGYHNAKDFEFDGVTMKTKLVVRPGIIAIRLDEKSFLVLFWVSTMVGIINIIINTLVRNF